MDVLTGSMEVIDAVRLDLLPQLSALVVWTWNSMYRIVVLQGTAVYVQGGRYFPDPTTAKLEGASLDDTVIVHGWICVGLEMHLRAGAAIITTSPVLAITADTCHQAAFH